MDTSQGKDNSSAQNKENIANGVQKDDSKAMEVESETSKPNLPDQNLDNNKTDNKPEFEIVNENYKNPGEEDQINIKVSDKDKDKDHKDKDKKKKKKKNKKKDKKDEAGQEDGGPTKKVKTSVLDNKNIPEELRQKYYEIEKNPLAVAIANIPIGVNKSELLTYFTTLLTSLQDVANPIRNIEVGATGNFAIMELDTKDIRDFCLTLENLEFKAYKLSILRVKGFFNKVYDAEASGIDPFGNISTVASSEDNKLYVGSIPLFLKEEDVRKICEAFGFLRYFNLVKDNEGNHKGYCFIEYMDTKSAEKALKGLNELDIGDRKLKVQKAVAVAAPKVVVPVHGAKPTNSSGSFLLGFPGIGDLNVQSMLNVPGSCKTPSRVIQILNMCTIEDLLEDDFYKDLMEDVREEAAKFGPIDTIVIPRPDQKTGVVGPSVGKIFVKFQYLIPAKQARHRLSGRSYNKRTIVTSFYPEEKFDTEEYLQNPL